MANPRISDTTLDQLIDRSQAYDARKTDYGPTQAIKHQWDPETCDLIVPTGMFNSKVRLPLTSRAINQVCERLGPVVWPGSGRTLPKNYIEDIDPVLRAINLNWHTERVPEERQWLVRGYDDQARAVLTERYSPLGVTDTLKWARDLTDTSNGHGHGGGVKLLSPYVTPDVCHVKMIFRSLDIGNGKGPYGTGAYFSTGEIGNRENVVAPFVMKTACTNSIWWMREGAWKHNHTGSLELLRREFLIHLSHAFDASEKILLALLDAEQRPLPDFDTVIKRMVKHNGWTEVIEADIFKGAGTDETVAAVVDGLTYAAQGAGEENQETQIQIEELAGEFLWNMTRTRERVEVR
jgi:hypothetical protein